MTTPREMIEKLKRYPQDEHMAFEIWQIDDVITRAAETGAPEVSKSEAETVLQMIEKYHDCNIGINWDVLDFNIWRLKEKTG